MLRLKRRRLFHLAFLSSLSIGWAPARAAGRTFTDVAELRAFVIATFKKRAIVTSVSADPADPAKFVITIGDWSSAGDVTNLFGYLRAYPDEDSEQLVERFVRSLIEGRSRKVDEADIIAVVRTRDYVDSLLRMGIDVLHEPLGADLEIVYMADRPDSISPIAPTDFPGRGIASIKQSALTNVKRWLPKIVSDDSMKSTVLYYVEDNTMLSTSLLLLDDFWQSIAARFPGDVLVALPRKDQLFIGDDGDPDTRDRIRRLIAGTIEENFNLLSPTLYARRNGKFVAVLD